MSVLRAKLSHARHALPGLVGRTVRAETTADAVVACRAAAHRGLATTVGYFHADDAPLPTGGPPITAVLVNAHDRPPSQNGSREPRLDRR